jgi:hypothetical protein
MPTRVDIKLLSIEHKFSKFQVSVKLQTGREYHWSNAKDFCKSSKGSAKQHIWNPPAMISLDLADVGKGDGVKFIVSDVQTLMTSVIGEAIINGLDKFNPMEEVHLRIPSNLDHFHVNVIVMVHGVPKGPTILQTTVIQQGPDQNSQFHMQQLQQQVFQLQNEIAMMQQRHQQEIAGLHAHYQGQGGQQPAQQVIYTSTNPTPPLYAQPPQGPPPQGQPGQQMFPQQPYAQPPQGQPQYGQPAQGQPQYAQPPQGQQGQVNPYASQTQPY